MPDARCTKSPCSRGQLTGFLLLPKETKSSYATLDKTGTNRLGYSEINTTGLLPPLEPLSNPTVKRLLTLVRWRQNQR
jgi:hypothetical protein